MGFALVVEGTQKAKIVAGHPGDPTATFVDAIREGLNQRITSFSVDMTKEPIVLDMILEPLRKLQHLLKSRGQNVSMTGSGLDGQSTLAQELAGLGILLPDVPGLVKRPAANAPISASESELISEEIKILFKEVDTDFDGELQLPPYERIAPYMSAVQARLGALLKMEDALKAEEETLSRRLTYLKKREPGGTKNLGEYNELLQEEEEINKLRDQIPKLKRELVVAKDSATNQENVFKDYSNRLDTENRKKLETLKKELQTLKDNYKKIQGELSKAPKANPPKKDET